MENKLFNINVLNVISENNRLFTTIKPIHYEIIIKPNMKNFTFKGKVSILIDFSEFINSDYSMRFTVNT